MQQKTGAIVNMAWPDTKVCKTSAIYDGPMTLVGLCQDGYYKVGHAACLLIDYQTGSVKYFDFGRYHTPDGYGRVRDVESDPELAIETKAIIIENTVANLPDILLELQRNPSTHGNGKLYASLIEDIDYDKAFGKAKQIQDTGATLYGPFQFRGTNCSRFVASIYKAGLVQSWKRWKINISYLYFHTCLTNIITTHTSQNVYVVNHGKWAYVEDKWQMYHATADIKVAEGEQMVHQHVNVALPDHAQCLTGIGGDTYFSIDRTDRSHLFNVKRFSEYGELEIDDIFVLKNIGFDISKPYRFTYISTGIAVKIKQGSQIFELTNTRYNQQNRKRDWRFKRYH